jgi:hypothetical protein
MHISRQAAERASVSVRLRRHAGASPLDDAGQPPGAARSADPRGVRGHLRGGAREVSSASWRSRTTRRHNDNIPRGGNHDSTSRRCV